MFVKQNVQVAPEKIIKKDQAIERVTGKEIKGPGNASLKTSIDLLVVYTMALSIWKPAQ